LQYIDGTKEEVAVANLLKLPQDQAAMLWPFCSLAIVGVALGEHHPKVPDKLLVLAVLGAAWSACRTVA